MVGEDAIGRVVAGFRIVSLLGRGGMGVVYLAEQSSPRRLVALKLLSPELSNDARFRERFARESEAAASTEHPNIVPIYAEGDADGVLYIAMRYVEGIDLQRLISDDGPLAPRRVAEIVSQIGAALDAAHRKGLVHRDVKPGNVLLDDHGNAYLTDFGLIKRSEITTGITQTGQFMGSIAYCAPEQIRGETVDLRADVYSLGCVLFECLAGDPPFDRETEVATLYAHLEEEPPAIPPAGSQPELDRVVATALAKRPADRFASAGDLARAVRRAVGVTSAERQAAEVPSPPGRRRQALVLGLGALVVAGAAALLIALSSGDTTSPPGTTQATGTGERLLNTVRSLDPETGEVLRSIDGIVYRAAPIQVGGFAAGEGGVWVANFANVQHVDPVTETVRGRIQVDSPFLSPLVAFRTVWVATDRSVERINPATDELLRATPLIPTSGIALDPSIAAGEGNVWVALEKTLYRIDPATGEVADEYPLEDSTGIAVGEGAVWVIDKLTGTLTAIDPGSGEPTAAATLPGNLDEVVAGGGWVWILDQTVGTVTLVDPATLTVEATVRAGDDERGIVFGADAVWLADGNADTVSRIDPLTRDLEPFPMGGPVANVAVDPGTGEVWVLLAEDEV